MPSPFLRPSSFSPLNSKSLLIALLLQFISPSIGHFTSVCQFPKLEDWLGCQRGDQQMAGAPYTSGGDFPADDSMAPLNGWFCDPESSISMSEVSALDDSIRRLYGQYGQQCVCPSSPPSSPLDKSVIDSMDESASIGGREAPSAHCWHRFGFAFVQRLEGPFPDVATAEQCSPPNSSNQSQNAAPSMFYDDSEEGMGSGGNGRDGFELPPNWERDPDNSFVLYAQNFVKVLRERWALGQCGEDLLLLVVQRPPVQQLSGGPLSSGTVRLFGPLPMLFVAPGPLVLDRLGPHLDLFTQEANDQLQREGRPLFRVLGQFLLRVGSALHRAQTGANQRPKLRSHVPLWAWAVFAACGVAFGLMALGLFLIRTGTRRSTIPGGQQQTQGHGAMVARRHWKEEEQPPPQTYVNLVQMLMPHPKPPPTNMPQQV